MAARTRVFLLALVIVCCAGCPDLFLRFTSADVANQLGWNGLFGLAVDEGTEGEGEPREVVEPDIIRLAGNLLYVLNQYRGLTLVDLDAQAIVAQVPTYGYPRDLYITADRAYVLVAYASEYTIEGNTVSFDTQARLYVVDISDPPQARVLGDPFDLEGDLVDSRLVGEVLYAVCAEYEWYWTDWGEGEEVAVATNFLKTQTSESWVTSVNVADPNHIYQADQISFAGYGNVIHATDTAIFAAAPDWSWWESGNSTTITYVDIRDPDGDMAVCGSVEVDGYVADRFEMDAYDGVLRVVSSGWWGDPRVYITTIDLADPDNLETLGRYELEDAVGEMLFATRFNGDLAYIVTFFMVDPLFVVDLSNPSTPVVAGALEVPGWSTHIEPMGDRLIALGVDDTEGRRVCVSLFDVSDPARLSDPDFQGLVDRVSFGEDWTWSSAYSDVKAFTVLDGLLIVPFSGWSSASGGYDRLQFITYDENDLDARGTVDLEGSILRSLEYNGMYYGVTTEQLATIEASDLDHPKVTHRLTLAEYVADFIELSPTLAAEIVVRHDTGTTLVRTVGLGKRGLGEVTVEIGSLTDAYAYGDSVVLVGGEWGTLREFDGGGEPYYTVVLVDCSDREAPVATKSVRLDVEPYWGYYWYGPEEPLIDLDERTKQAIAPWWIPSNPERVTFLVGDTLAVRCHAEQFDTCFGSEEDVYQGLALVDLGERWLSYTTVGLGFEQIVSLDAAGGKLYLGTRDPVRRASLLGWWRPLCAYYLRQVDVIEPSIGPAANVPGMFVQYDPSSDVLVLKDHQWTNGGAVKSHLRTATWDGTMPISSLDSLELPTGADRTLGRGEKVYVDCYWNGYRLYAASVGPEGRLSLGDGVLVTEQWGTLLDANDESAYVSIGNAIARYDFSGEGQLAELIEVMGYPLGIRFGTRHAFVSLGYFGMAVLAL